MAWPQNGRQRVGLWDSEVRYARSRKNIGSTSKSNNVLKFSPGAVTMCEALCCQCSTQVEEAKDMNAEGEQPWNFQLSMWSFVS